MREARWICKISKIFANLLQPYNPFNPSSPKPKFAKILKILQIAAARLCASISLFYLFTRCQRTMISRSLYCQANIIIFSTEALGIKIFFTRPVILSIF